MDWLSTMPEDAVLRRRNTAEEAGYQLGQAHGCLEKAAGDKAAGSPTRVHALAGRLYLSKSGWLLMHISNQLIRGVFDSLDEPGLELPLNAEGQLVGHVSVMQPAELEQIGGGDKISERGHSFRFNLGPLQVIEPAGWSEMSRAYLLEIRSPALQKLRASYGLSPLPKYPFHATVAVRRKNVLNDNAVTKVADDAGELQRARNDRLSGVQQLAGNEGAVLQPQSCTTQGLRCEGYQNLQKAADLQRVLRNYGCSAVEVHTGPQGNYGPLQLWGLRRMRSEQLANELPVGDTDCTSEKQAKQPSAAIPWGDTYTGGMVRTARAEIGDSTDTYQQTRLECGKSIKHAAGYAEEKHELVDLGRSDHVHDRLGQGIGHIQGSHSVSNSLRYDSGASVNAAVQPGQTFFDSCWEDYDYRRMGKTAGLAALCNTEQIARWLANSACSVGNMAAWNQASASISGVTGYNEVSKAAAAATHWRYRCPHCGSDKAYNGIPGTDTKFRGSARCTECGKDFTVIHGAAELLEKDVPTHKQAAAQWHCAGCQHDFDGPSFCPKCGADCDYKTAADRTQERIEAAEAQVHPEPTTAQREAGNYRHGHLTIHGLDITLEVAKGGTRSGTDKTGKKWSVSMGAAYGYIKRTSGADGEHFDVYIGPHPESELVFIINQVDPKTGKFDELKGVLGTNNEEEARETYLSCYSDGWKGLGSINSLTMLQFHWYLGHGDTTKEIKDGHFAAPGNLRQKAASLVELLKHAAKDRKIPTVAVDLDGTLATYDHWRGEDHFGEVRPGAKKALEEFQRRGYRIIIWTTRGNKEKVKQFLHDNDLPFSYLNINPDQPPGSSPKVIADLYIDDRALAADGPWKAIAAEAVKRLEKAFAKEADDRKRRGSAWPGVLAGIGGGAAALGGGTMLADKALDYHPEALAEIEKRVGNVSNAYARNDWPGEVAGYMNWGR